MEEKTIIVINDNTAAAGHAALLGLKLAQQIAACIVLANDVKVTVGQAIAAYQSSGKDEGISFAEEPQSSLLELLQSHNGLAGQAKINISEIDISQFVVDDLSRFIIKNKVWMIIKGTNSLRDQTDGLHINI